MRRNFLIGQLALLFAGLVAAGAASAQAEARFPSMVKIVVPFAAGASNDAIARVVAPLLAKRLGSSVIIENKPGAAGVIGADSVAKSARDGGTLLLTSSTFLTAAATQARQPYDALGAFTPVAMLGHGPLLLAVPAASPIKSPADLLAVARAKPGALAYGSAGVGSIGHMATEMLSESARLQMTHIPYKGASLGLIDLAAGQIDLMVSNFSSLVPHIKSGKLRAVGVTSPQANAAFPELMPLASAVPGYAIDIWVAVLVPAGTSALLVQRLNRELNEIAVAPELRALLEPDGAQPMSLSPAALAQRFKEELARWKQIAAEKKIVAE